MKRALLLLALLIPTVALAADNMISCEGNSCKVRLNPRTSGGVKTLIADFTTTGSTIGAVGSQTIRLNGYGLLNFDNADTNVATTDAFELRRTTSGTAAAGFGGRLAMSAENASGNQPSAAYMQWELSNAGNGTEASKLSFWTRTGGAALVKAMEIQPTGDVTFPGAAGTFTASCTGPRTTSPTWKYQVVGNIVTISWPSNIDSSCSANFFTCTGLPTVAQSATTQTLPMFVQNNGVAQATPGFATVSNTVIIGKDWNASNFTNAANCGFYAGSITYNKN